ncbi:class F sortase [Prescottella sp. R16]|uniref:class F sortase n=1 Tax=Prescottella sp. R16 TaxID=3064529 RepID=UPI00272E5FD1|nr:class F sortase [Prescottella sp. R16]
MDTTPTGRPRHTRRGGLSAVLAACTATTITLAGCTTTGPVSLGELSPHPGITTPAETAVLRPDHLVIPAIRVDTDLMDLGLESDGTLEVPPGAFPAGWYTGSPVPGDLGPAVLAGHVDWNGETGVFHRLHELEPGDEIITRRTDGTTAVFRVGRVENYAKTEFPTLDVYGDIDHPGIRLITCGGEFDTAAGSYRDNTVVYADLVT